MKEKKQAFLISIIKAYDSWKAEHFEGNKWIIRVGDFELVFNLEYEIEQEKTSIERWMHGDIIEYDTQEVDFINRVKVDRLVEVTLPDGEETSITLTEEQQEIIENYFEYYNQELIEHDRN